jgi:mRNA interferase YafQ
MLTVVRSSRFLKEAKLAQRRGRDIAKLDNMIALLCAETPLPDRFHDHSLTGDWHGYRDCHIEPDWLLIYKVDGHRLYLARTGTHSDLFSR